MSVNLTPSRSPYGSPAFSPANRPAYRGGAVAGGGGGGGTDLTDSSGYPLDDDGTMAGAFGYAALATSAPNYHLVSYTYANDAASHMALAADVGAAMITVGASKKLGCQFAVTAFPGSADFNTVNLVAAEFSGGSPTGNSWNIALSKSTSPNWSCIASSGAVPNSRVAYPLPAYNNAYVGGILLDGSTGQVSYYDANGGQHFGNGGVASLTFTPGNQIVLLLVLNDNLAAPVGQTIALRIIPNAADMIPIGFPTGVTDWNGQACPSGGP